MEAYITEVTATQWANEISLHVYEFPVEDPTKKYEGASMICKAWRRANDYMAVAFNQSTIVTFEPVNSYAGFEPLSYEIKTINPNNPFETRLLERLIKESLLAVGQKQLKMKRAGSDLQEWNPKKVGNILIYPALSFHINILANSIHIGFHLTHKFEYEHTLQQMIERGEVIEPGLKVLHSDIRNNYTYEVEQIAPYSVMEYCPKLKKSIYQYYNAKGDTRVIEALHDGVKVIYAKPIYGDSLSYAATVLKPLCSFETMKSFETKKVMDILKMKPDERMKKQLRQAMNLLNVYPYLTFEKNPFLIEANNYELYQIQDPKIFMDRSYFKPLHGMKNGKLFKSGTIRLSIFMDEAIEKKLGISKALVFRFIKILQQFAKQQGVTLEISHKTREVKEKFTEEFFQQFSWEIRELESIFIDSTVLAIITDEHLTKLPIKVYDAFKRQFGGKWDISTQVITENSLKLFQQLLKRNQLDLFNPNDEVVCQEVANRIKSDNLFYTINNILLGVYVKSGMQPWVLDERTHSDCFIGLDVSHEDGKSTAGIMNVIGSNGHLLKQSAIHGALAGEKIDTKTLEEILMDVLFTYKNQFGDFPKHVTIHRDGKWNEDTEFVDKLFKARGVAYDIIEVIKKSNRRMAFYNETTKKFETRQGVYYKREKEAFLCATDPRENIGMAQPIKIVQYTKTLTFEQLIEDVYRLSFMHIHSLNKMRLPATIHYADLSSTAYQRGQVAPRTTNVTHLPFV
ncbi:Piwi domain-containing protein [Bacillus sp. FJAT-42315]|uniref:Piwi domain-containing protein n=1 Tax=Bacillus sp. FJAT-42315 TaxID=2014077 RepID=UPI000C24B8AF|nr:Piwi domain-containing protein [Bacillus sp. FJAT-42315]